jgi:pyruvate dehydrogenase E1 component alpha subunit
MADPQKYRTREEVEEYKRRDGVNLARQRLVEEFGVEESVLLRMEEEIESAIQDSVEFAEQSPAPDVAELERYTISDGEED